ncbi:MAG: CRISPR-associated endoribonuclease Cas6 [Bacillota bacterium]
MLYSVIVRFKALENITFKYYPGESLHGMLFQILSERDKDKADVLHNQYETKPFTISPIIPYPKWNGSRMELKSDKEHFFRITFLEEKWYVLFMSYFLHHHRDLQLQGSNIEIIEVLTNSKEDKRCKSLDYQELMEQAETRSKIKFKVHSTTTFRVGDRHIIFPAPNYLFHNLLNKWQMFGDEELSLEDKDFDKVYVSRYDLQSAMEKFRDYPIKGFKGKCEYELDNTLSKQKKKEINLLFDFAFYSGIGYKTTMGLGQVARQKI